MSVSVGLWPRIFRNLFNVVFVHQHFIKLYSYYRVAVFLVRLCRLCVVIRMFHICHNCQWTPTLKDFYPLHVCPILILEKEPVFPCLMLSAKQGKYWYHFHIVFGMTRSLIGDWNPGPPALEASLHCTTRLSWRSFDW